MRGRLVVGSFAAPAAGQEVSLPVPAGKRWRMKGITFRLVTSAVAGTRHVNFVLDDGAGNILAFGMQNTDQAVSTALGYVLGEFGQLLAVNTQLNVGSVTLFVWPSGIDAVAGMRYRTKTGGLLAGDQFSGNFDAPGNPIPYYVEEWDA